MIIIAGYSLTEADQRDAVVAAFVSMTKRAREQEGCLDVSISADSADPERVNVFELWRDQQALNAWRKVARGPRVKFKATHVKLYRTDQAENPFCRVRTAACHCQRQQWWLPGWSRPMVRQILCGRDPPGCDAVWGLLRTVEMLVTSPLIHGKT